MSNKAINWALRQRTGSSTRKLILLRLADQANDDGKCWPGKESISWHCECSKQTVRRALRDLERDGFIKTTRPSESKRRTNLYWLQIDGGTDCTPPGVTEYPPGGSQSTPNPYLEPSMNPQKPCPANAEASAEPYQKKPDRPRDPIWDTLMEVCGIETTAIPQSARGGYNRAVKELKEVGATPDQIRNRASRWHKVYSGATLTPTALVKHWASLAGSQPKKQSEGRIPV